MQTKKQQKETKKYFNKTAKDWKKKSNSLKIKVPVIQQRNSYVLSHIIQRKDKVSNFLDVGCGTGELAYEVSKQKINSIGIDFSDKMIELCNKFSNVNLQFECADALNYSSKIKFDVISANGFLEYISLRELYKFLKKIRKNLYKDGYLIFSVRNRLFNLFSLNEFTKNEINSNSINKLIQECIFFAENKKIKDIGKIATINFQKNTLKHKNTGIGVSSRFQYTPSQIFHILKNINFKLEDLAGINTHLLPRSIGKNDAIKNKIYFNINKPKRFGSFQNIPYSSTFMVKAIKC